MNEEFGGGEEFASHNSDEEDFSYYSKLIDKHRQDMDTVRLEPRTGYPPVAITILYGPHVSAADAEPIQEALIGMDVYIPELCGWDKRAVSTFQKVAAGTLPPEKAVPKQALDRLGLVDDMAAYKRAQMRSIAENDVLITCIDVPYPVVGAR